MLDEAFPMLMMTWNSQLAARCQRQRLHYGHTTPYCTNAEGRDGPCTCRSCRRGRGHDPSFPCSLETDLPFFFSVMHTHSLVLHGMALHGNSMDQVSLIISKTATSIWHCAVQLSISGCPRPQLATSSYNMPGYRQIYHALTCRPMHPFLDAQIISDGQQSELHALDSPHHWK